MSSSKKLFENRQEAITFSKNPLIAENDITVYKMLDKDQNKYYSPCQYTQYCRGELKTADGFGFDILSNRITINNGIHAYTDKHHALGVATIYEYSIVIKCYIPKGTPYFIGIYNEIVSLALQMPKVFNVIK